MISIAHGEMKNFTSVPPDMRIDCDPELQKNVSSETLSGIATNSATESLTMSGSAEKLTGVLGVRGTKLTFDVSADVSK